jgi:enoyl-CoA hydratase/carnithine racemase
MTADTFRSTFRPGAVEEEWGPFAGQPLCIVQLDDGPDIEPLTRFLPCVVAGVASGTVAGIHAPDVDLLVTDDQEAGPPWIRSGDLPSTLDALGTACRASPLASIALAQLLRFNSRLGVPDALVAESFVYSMLQAGPEHRAWLAARPPRSGPRTAPRGAMASREPDAVLTTRDGDVLSIRFDRPRVHNAYNTAMRDGLSAALQVADADPSVRQVDITGVGPSFCSGGDLGEFGSAPDPVTAHAVRVSRGAAIWMDRCSGRTTVHVHGACIGAGVELAAFAGSVVADPDTFFRLPEVAMGLIPGAGGTVSLPRRIGRQRTAYLAISGNVLETPTAAEWGLVDRIAPPDQGHSPDPV